MSIHRDPAVLVCLAGALCGTAAAQVPTTLEDFFLPGHQPPGAGSPAIEPFVGVFEGSCVNCHAGYDAYVEAEPFRHWVGSMMAQAYRDPFFQAALVIANQDAAFSGDLCLRCHTPAGWLGGRSTPTDGSALSEPADFEGMACHFCHRAVDAHYVAGVSPIEDVPILADLAAAGLLPVQADSGRFVVDPDDKVRRGPLADVHHPQGATAIYSPLHSTSEMCAFCHDVSNPAFSRQTDGSYLPNELDAPHPTMDKFDMFPVERTYSEWTRSQFANGGVQLDGRFGGEHATGIMESCQDCHMPDQLGPAARSGTVHPDAPQHAFLGGNSWSIHAIRSLYSDAETGLTPEFADESAQATVALLQAASDMELDVADDDLVVRIINYGAHKLPSGYPEGRRAWINVRFLDDSGVLCDERGTYDPDAALLSTDDTKVYETKLGLDAFMADLTGLPQGPSFHMALANTIVKDNRIPPIGYTNEAFAAVQAAPVGYAYADGQHWDDTAYDIPACAASADVTFYYQTISRDYIEFLRDENRTDERGTIAYGQWIEHGRSAPVIMDAMSITFESADTCPWDIDDSGEVAIGDLLTLLAAWGGAPGGPPDFDGDGIVGVTDLLDLLAHWGPCPL